MKSQSYLTKNDLQARGWKDKSIKYFLKKHDKAMKHVGKSLPTKLYDLKRVIEIENSQSFKVFNPWRCKENKNVKVDKIKAPANNFGLCVPLIEQELLYKEACQFWHFSKEEYYLNRQQYNIFVKPLDYRDCDESFLHHITIQYLKHLSFGQVEHHEIQNKTFIEKEKNIKSQILFYKQVSKKYPFLAQACESQILKLTPI